MISEKVGNPILVITEYLGVLANLGLYTEPSYPNPEVIFHDMNETLMNIWLEQALPTQRNNAKRMDKELNETMEIISDEELLNVEVGEDDSEVILDETWKEMKALYGNKKYAKTQIEKTTHLLIGDAITIYERVIDNILVSYLEHYSVSPLQNSSKQCLLRAGMKEVYPIIGELIKDEKIREYYLKTGNNIYFNSKHYMRPSSNQLDVFKNISKEILNQE